MTSHAAYRIRLARCAAGLLPALAVVAMLGITARPAAAYATYVHGGITTCAACHQDGHTNWKPVSEVCNTCHPGFAVPSASTTCWTCHTPGQDMSAVRNDAACTSACHMADGTASTHAPHPDRPATCTLCHPLSASITDPAGSPHHTAPLPSAPTVTGFLPASVAVGDLVTLTGTGFVGVLSVSFNGTPADVFTLVSDTRLTAIVPRGAISGPLAVTTPGGTGTSARSLSVLSTVIAKVSLGVRPSTVAPGRAVRASGSVAPAAAGGEWVRLTVRLRASGSWMTTRVVIVRTSARGAYSWTYEPPWRGRYSVGASVAGTTVHAAARSRWVAFAVK
jgi:hypothetical protein